MSGFESTVLLLTRDGLGHAPADLQHTLLDRYLRLMLQETGLPAVFCFYTEGVRLVTEGSPALGLLRSLEARGVRLIVCGTCLDYFGLRERVQVGIVGGMPDILEAQRRADKVITL